MHVHMDLRHFLALLLRWAWFILLLAFLSGTMAYIASSRQRPVYQVSTMLLVDEVLPVTNDSDYEAIMSSERRAQTYARLLTTTPVLAQVIHQHRVPTDVENLRRAIYVQPVRDTQLIEVQLRGSDPQQAAQILNALARSFIQQWKHPRTVVRQVEAAVATSEPIAPLVVRTTMFAVLLELLVVIGVLVVREMFSDSVNGPEEVERRTDLPVLGMLMHVKSALRAKVFTAEATHEPAAEAFRALRTDLRLAGGDDLLGSLLITSPTAGEGKSFVAANLAAVMAQSGLHVVLVDADLRNPTLHLRFGLSNRRGLTDLFLNPGLDLDNVVQPTEVTGLWVLTAGDPPRYPAELLGSDRMETLVKRMRDKVDLVVFDSPPVSTVTDPVVLATYVDGVLLVVRSGLTQNSLLRRTIEQLRRTGTRLMGVVLNDVPQGIAGSIYGVPNPFEQSQASVPEPPQTATGRTS